MGEYRIEFHRLGVDGGGPVCDFCLDPAFLYRYRTTKFSLPAEGAFPPYQDDGAWAACEKCMNAIEARDFEEMDNRLLMNMIRNAQPGEVVGPFTLSWTHRLRNAFLANLREGPIADG